MFCGDFRLGTLKIVLGDELSVIFAIQNEHVRAFVTQLSFWQNPAWHAEASEPSRAVNALRSRNLAYTHDTS